MLGNDFAFEAALEEVYGGVCIIKVLVFRDGVVKLFPYICWCEYCVDLFLNV